MSYEAQGRVLEVGIIQQVSEKFRKRELILELPDDKYPQTCAFEFTQDRVDVLDSVKAGDEARVEFNLRGRQWTSPKTGEIKTFTTLSGWRVEVITKAANAEQAPEGVSDDIPF